MKVAIYIEDGVKQLVLTPTDNAELEIIKELRDGKLEDAQVVIGSFYDCRGGWVRQSKYVREGGMENFESDDLSLIIKYESDNRA